MSTYANDNGSGNLIPFPPDGPDEYQSRFLKISGIGRDRLGIVYRIAKTIRKNGGNILLQRSMKVAGEFAVTVIASFERENAGRLPSVAQAFTSGALGDNFFVSACEIELSNFAPQQQGGTKYVLIVTGDDRMGIVETVTLLLLQNNINLDSVECEVSYRPFQGTPTFSAIFEITIPEGFDMQAFLSELEQLEMNTDLTIIVRQH
jgi:glycine cleavage system regulatory protein